MTYVAANQRNSLWDRCDNCTNRCADWLLVVITQTSWILISTISIVVFGSNLYSRNSPADCGDDSNTEYSPLNYCNFRNNHNFTDWRHRLSEPNCCQNNTVVASQIPTAAWRKIRCDLFQAVTWHQIHFAHSFTVSSICLTYTPCSEKWEQQYFCT